MANLQRRSGYSGFTLIELIVSILIVAVIAAILWPVSSGCGGPAPSSRCVSFTKQCLLASLMYADDYDDRLPLVVRWGDILQPYAKSEEMLKDVEGIPKGTYGRAFRKSASGIAAKSVKSPQGYVLIFDSTLLSRNAASELGTLPHPGRHHGKDIVGYLDGHSKALPMP